MRSRFSAFAIGDRSYLLRSWHPSTRPETLELDPAIVWRRLQIVDTVAGGAGDDTGVVGFRASFRGPDGGAVLHERSRFARDPGPGRAAGEWRYLDGDASHG